MNREIKFRAWSKSNGCFCSAFSIHMSGMVSDMIDAKIDEDSGLAISDAHWCENDLEVMQYTGLLDKNGVEIYEGDIVKFDTQSGRGKKSIVEWDDSASFFPFYDTTYTDDEQGDWFKGGFEVIGNIYENPELLDSNL